MSEVQWITVMDSTDGPVEHARILCVDRHWFFLPVAALGPSPRQTPEDAAPVWSPGWQQTVRQVMTPPMITIEGGAHLAAAAYLMKHAHDASLMVVADNTREPVAIITEADIANAVARGRNVEDTRVHEVVTATLVTVRADAVIADAIRLMLPEGARQLPVVEGRRFVGMVELADLVQTYLMPGPVAVAEA